MTAGLLARRIVPAMLATAAVVLLLASVRPRPAALPSSRPPPLDAGPSTKIVRGVSTRRPRRPGRVRTGLSTPFTTPFSFIQVRVAFTGRELTRVETVEMSGVGARTQAINTRAEPILRSEALRANGRSDIDTVTGATYTSQSYRKALQSAIDRARGG
jgi:uncharacterized protein with FMN-binding domain